MSNDTYNGCKFEEVSRVRNTEEYPTPGCGYGVKWKGAKITKEQSTYLKQKCLEAIENGHTRCHSVQGYLNRFDAPPVPLPTATRPSTIRTKGYHGYEYYDIVRTMTGFTGSKVRGALNSLIRAGKIERTRGGKNEKPSNTHYHLVSEMSPKQKREVANRELKAKTAKELKKLFKGLKIDAYIDVCETTSISIVLGTQAAVKLRKYMENTQ